MATRRALIVDDEPEHLSFVEEFLAAQGLAVEFAVDVADALAKLRATKFTVVLVDMNIPAVDAIDDATRARVPLVTTYPGIMIADYCRNTGYGAHTVIAYTVHDDDAADAELRKLNCRYVLKGRPQVLKQVLRSSLGPKPPG